jgi:hypothetical protein
VLDLLRDLSRLENKTIIMVLHDLNLACRYADHTVAVHERTAFAQGLPEDVLTQALVKTVFDLNCRIIPDLFFGTPIQLVTPELLNAYRSIPSSTIGHFSDRGFLRGIKPLFNNIRMVGNVVTVKVFPPDGSILREALLLSELGDVLMIECVGDEEFGCWGELRTLAGLIKGLAGGGGVGCGHGCQRIASPWVADLLPGRQCVHDSRHWRPCGSQSADQCGRGSGAAGGPGHW